MRTLKILFLSYYHFPHVGAGTWSVYEILQGLSKNATVHLIVPNVAYSTMINYHQAGITEREYFNSTFPVTIKLPSKVAAVMSGFLLFLKGLSFKEFDIIITRYQPNHTVSLGALFLSKILKKPLIVTASDVYRIIHTEKGVTKFIFLYKIFGTVIEKLLLTYANKVGVVCSEHKEILVRRFGTKAKNVLLLPNGVNYDKLVELKKRLNYNSSKIKKQLGVLSETKIIIFVGRIGPEYGLESLLGALPILKSSENIHLFLVGEGQEEKQLVKLVKELKISDIVTITGAVRKEKVMEYLAVADVAIGPLGSTRTIPGKIFEYFAFGKAVISGTGSLSCDFAINGENCLLVEPSPQNIAEAISMLLKNDELRRKLGTNAERTAMVFRWENTVSVLFQCISKISVMKTQHMEKDRILFS